jgi:hypothetical protein
MTPWGSPPRPGCTGAPSRASGSVDRMSRGSPRMRQTPPSPPRSGAAATVMTRATAAAAMTTARATTAKVEVTVAATTAARATVATAAATAARATVPAAARATVTAAARATTGRQGQWHNVTGLNISIDISSSCSSK